MSPGRRARPPKVGLFGLLGSGNLGNDGSLESVLKFLEDRYPDAVVDFLCAGPETVRERYGLDAERLHWNRGEYETASGIGSIARKGLGKLVDAARIARWVRRHDVVIVPGMGVLEATLPLRPWGFPYSLFLLTTSGRLFGTPVALVSVGANPLSHRATRIVFTTAARNAAYRSYRDEPSRDALRRMGVDTSGDRVYPDLVFSLPTPPAREAAPGTIGLGVMDYHGGNDDRARADEIHESYVAKIKDLVNRLLDAGHRIRLFTGDVSDEKVVRDIFAALADERPGLPPGAVVFDKAGSLAELMGQMSTVDAVVATRFHNVLCALKTGTPTISLGYATKNDVLMAQMGLGSDFCQTADGFTVDQLVKQLEELLRRADGVKATLADRGTKASLLLEEQFDVLSTRFFGGRE
ncbi:polysaccharide pyruvyl transferase family protein [Amycolatopsis sp. NPDC051128]|uniref:polysaccharide pyruvyl transferase family protein n=1 Tax=Amycolatopsis sp. NPDC051128 TaxID=3155412 RepID=UPI003436899D